MSLVINGVVSLRKTDNMDQGNIIYIWGSLEDYGHTVKINNWYQSLL
jgi:hypothetical protein